MYNPPPCVAIVALPLDGDAAAEVVLLLLVMFVALPVVLELVPPTIVCPSVVVLPLEVVVVLPDVVVFPVVVELAVAPVLAELLVVAAILVVVSSEEAIEPVAVNVEPPAVVAFVPVVALPAVVAFVPVVALPAVVAFVPVVALPAVVAFVPVVAFDVRFCATAVLERLDAVTKSPKTSTSAIAIDAFFIARRAYIDQF
jgi:hypothetical protein